MRNFYLSIFLFFSFCLIFPIYSQEFTPVVNQFSKADYNAANQNWAVGQSADGVMYFGNNQGLLQFDGINWELYKMPQNKTVRSLLVARDQRIYTGSFEEFGYFEMNAYGQLKYTSLSSKLKNYKMQNDEIWTILEDNGTIVFQSFTSYFTFRDGVVKGYRCPFTFLFFNLYRHKIFSNTDQYGLSVLDAKSKTFVKVPNSILKSEVVAVLNFDSAHALLVTKSDGLFLFDGSKVMKFDSNDEAELKRSQVNHALISPDGVILIGTILDGVIALNKRGKKLWTLNTSNVLQNNTVLGMYCDRDNNLWLALDKGISLIQLNSSLSYIHAFSPSIGAIYSVSYASPDLFIGTNQGLYKAKLIDRTIQQLQLEPRIKGQVWTVNNFDHQQICGNNEQTFEVSDHGIIPISSIKGGICIKKGYIHGVEVLVQGTYTQLCIYERNKARWVFSHSLSDFLNPIRYIEVDYTGTIWASHLHQGLFAIQLSNDLKKIEHIFTYTSLDGIHQYPINVFSINNRVVFTDRTGFYTFDDIQKKIIRFDELNKSLGYFAHAYRVCPFTSDKYWFINNDEAALFEIKLGKARLLDVVNYALFLNQTIDDYQNIIPISDTSCIFTLENGLALYDINHTHRNQPRFHLELKTVQTYNAEGRDVVFLKLKPNEVAQIPFIRNNIAFNFYLPEYTHLNALAFSYKLDGLDKVWSIPTTSSRRIYSYLPYGKYTLRAVVTTNSGIQLSSKNYNFEILPPFYWSITARILYIMLIALMFFMIYFYIHRRFLIKKDKIMREHEELRKHEIEKREKQIMTLEKEKLEAELGMKSKELAISTMTLIKKNEILVNIKDEVNIQKKALGSQYPNKYYEKLKGLIDENLSSEDDWAIFQTNFDRIHENFFRNLHTRYPELTSNDLRFCAYLRLNLTSKDIAHLMNISLKGVEVGRYRIRKKIGLPSTKSLTEFMIEFK